MVYRGARRSDIATQGKTATEDLHMDMDDRGQCEMVYMVLILQTCTWLVTRKSN